jgi:hypothetical protein
MNHVVTVSLVIAAVIHLLPLSGVIGVQRLELLYGTPIMDPNLEILMRHRAVLFGMLGMFLLFAAFRPQLQVPAFVLGFTSVLSFLWLAWSVGGYNAHIGRVFAADIVALVALVVGAVAYALPRAP